MKIATFAKPETVGGYFNELTSYNDNRQEESTLCTQVLSKNFSHENNKKQIGLYNIDNELFIPKAKLKTHGSKNFFYGHDGVIEDNLSNIEGDLSKIIKDIVQAKNIRAL